MSGGIKYIVVAFFLSCMLFTVIQYLPLLEEETRHLNTELCKKGGLPDTSNGPDEDQDPDSEKETLKNIENKFHLQLFIRYDDNNYIRHHQFWLIKRPQKVLIPPPKA